MEYIIPCVEQLELATQELNKRNPINTRLALILTDNVVELACHYRCQRYLILDIRLKDKIRSRRLTNRRMAILGNYFEEKISFLQGVGLLTKEEQEFISIAHSYRNKAYHVGLQDESIMWCLAWHYHNLCCEIFGRFKVLWICYRSQNIYSERAMVHLERTGFVRAGLGEVSLPAIAESLSSAKLPNDKPLGEVLSDRISAEINRLESNIEFLMSNRPDHPSNKELIRDVQHDYDVQEKLGELKWDMPDDDYLKEYLEIEGFMKSSWKPRYNQIPIQSWHRRALSVAKESNYLLALKKFESIRSDMKYTAETFAEAAQFLDGWIQEQCDIARGK